MEVLTAKVHCGGNCNADNGMITEELMEDKNLVWLNNGSVKRFNARTGTESAIDPTVVSDSFMKHPGAFTDTPASSKHSMNPSRFGGTLRRNRRSSSVVVAPTVPRSCLVSSRRDFKNLMPFLLQVVTRGNTLEGLVNT